MKNNTFGINQKDWKSTGLAALAIWVIFALLESFLFSIALFLVKLVLVSIGLYLVFRTGWLLYPIVKKRMEGYIDTE